MATKEKGKKRAAPTLRIKVWAGTPNHHEDRVVDTEGRAKEFLLDRIDRRLEWADTYNHACARNLRLIRATVDEFAVKSRSVRTPMAWKAVDEHTGVVFEFGFEVQAK